jgi:hypothetical protein
VKTSTGEKGKAPADDGQKSEEYWGQMGEGGGGGILLNLPTNMMELAED